MRSINKSILVAMALTSSIVANVQAAATKTFNVDSSGGSSIQFVSDAPLEKFTGKSTSVSGSITVDPSKPQKAKGELKVDVATIKTNVALRDEHLAGEDWLDAKKHPQAKFSIVEVMGTDSLKPNDVTELTVKGKFSLHGVTKDITSKAKVRYTPGAQESLRIQTTFTVHLEDYKVSIPAIVALKVSPDIVVNVDVRANGG